MKKATKNPQNLLSRFVHGRSSHGRAELLLCMAVLSSCNAENMDNLLVRREAQPN